MRNHKDDSRKSHRRRFFSPFSTPIPALFRACGLVMGTGDKNRPKTLLAGVDTALQTLLYLRRPFSPRKKAHSSRHFLLRLICHAPGASSGGLCPGACARRTPFSPPPAAPGWKGASSRGAPMRFALGLLLLLTFAAVVQHPVDHPVVVLQVISAVRSGFSGSTGRAMICPFRLMNCSGA